MTLINLRTFNGVANFFLRAWLMRYSTSEVQQIAFWTGNDANYASDCLDRNSVVIILFG